MKKVWNFVTTTILIVLLLGIAIMYIPKIFGIQPMIVLSGSMEPTYHVGSLLYIKNADANEIEAGDPITFYLDDNTLVTHRVVEIDKDNQTYTTKGDANEKEDLYPVGYDYYMGKVVYSVPVLGRVLAFFVTFHGKIAAGSLIGLAILLQIIGGVMESANEKKQAKISQK